MKIYHEPVIVIYSHIVGLAVIRALGRLGVPVVVLHYLPVEFGYVSKYVARHLKITSPNIDEQAFVADVLALSGRYPGALLIPTDDYTVIALSRNKRLLEKHFCVAVEEWSLVERLIEKQHTYKLAAELGVPHPRTAVCDSVEEIEAELPRFTFPCVLKPCQGHLFFDRYRLKLLVIRDATELRARFRELQQFRFKVMLQEIIPGGASEGVNYNSYFVDCEPIAEFTAEKVRIDPPFFGSPRVIVSKRIPQIIEPGRRLLKALGYRGFSCIEFKRDIRDGVYKLMEINARHNLSGSLAVACGINFPWIMYRDQVMGKKEYRKDFIEGLYWIDLTKDLMRLFASRKEEGYSIGEYFAPYLRRHVFAILDARDPLPFVKRCIGLLRKLSGGSIHARG